MANEKTVEPVDLELLRMISGLLLEESAPLDAERRGAERRAYPCVQLMAPFDGERMPNQNEFRQVLCHDLSPSGFSFLTYQRPRDESLVVALGAVPFLFVVAEVIRVNRLSAGSGHEFFVGCRFTRRLN